jgi:hypothetical protein
VLYVQKNIVVECACIVVESVGLFFIEFNDICLCMYNNGDQYALVGVVNLFGQGCLLVSFVM